MNRRVLSATLVLILCWSSLAIPDEFFGKNKVQYKSFNWTYIQSPNFDLYYYEGEYELAKFSVAVLESALVTIEDQLDYRLKGRVPVFLYNSPNDFQQTNVTPGLLPEGVGGFTESFKNRVVLPFNGSYEDLRHVLHHELTHAVTFDWFYGKAFGTLVSRQYLFHLPLWFAEGYAEYSSRLGWDYEADMVMRDAVIHGYLIPFERLGGYLAYKEGQAAVKYIAERYGEEKLHEILAKGKSTLSLGKAIKAAIGLSEKELFEQFSKYQKRIYWPELATRKEPGEIAKRLTNHEKDASYFNEKPAFSPEGDKLAIFSDRSDFTEIYLISAIDGKKINRLVKSARSGDLESLHSYVSGISWSPEGDRLAFVAKSRGFDAIFIYDIKKDKIIDKLRLKFNSIYSPAWGSDEKIAFTGVESNQADIYLVDVATATVARITNDRYEQKDIAFSPDGSRIAFASDQPVAAGDSGQFLYGTYNIFLMDIESGAIKAVTFQEGVCRWPQWSPDGSKLCFTSNINGINNLYVKELDTDKQPYPITNVLTGIKSPSWSRDGKKIAFSSFFKGGYDIYVLKDIRPVTDEGAPLAKTKFALGELRADYTGTILAEDENDSTSSEDIAVDSILEDSEEYDDYVFTPPSRETPPVPGEITADKLEEEEPEDDGRDTLYAPLPGGEYEVKKYKAKFTPDLVSGGISYDAFYGMRGQTLILFSDYLGNHQFFIFTDLVNSINQSNFLAIYLNSTHRIDFGVGLFYNKNHFIDPHNRLFSDRTYGLMASVWYPFSMYRRLQLDLSQVYIDRTYFDPPYDDSNDNVTTLDLSFIHDNVLWGMTGPVNGSRWKLTWERTVPVTSDSRSYWATELDYRRYWHIKGAYLVALRATGGASFGSDRKTYYLGGTTNYIGSADVGTDVYSVEGFYFSKIVTPLRGYDYFEFSGSKYALINAEFRYPFLDYLAMSFPLPLVISRVSGAIFVDVGSAWTRNSMFKGATSQGGTRLLDIKSGFGIGARLNLGIFLLRYDLGWGTDLDRVSKPHHYFSFGAEF